MSITATLTLTTTSANGRFDNLQYPANQYDYFLFGLWKWKYETGWVWQEQGIKYGSDCGDGTWTDYTFYGMEIGAWYQIEFWVLYGGNWFPSDPFNGGVGILTEYLQCKSPRPDSYYWSTPIYSGYNVNFDNATKTIKPISAAEFNGLLSRINEFRVYKGLNEYSYMPVSSGDNFTKDKFNQARSMMVDLYTYFNGYSLLPYRTTNDSVLQASIYQNLTNCLNSIT